MTPNSSPVPGPRAPSRRSFLASATVAAAAVGGGASFLTACGSSDSGK
ncbi:MULTISPECIES: ubiquinol-cytochrome c reductase iron-sulfur subunit N-terminal domain-containing protein [Streptomyces]|uniref:Ubiquinol-cytochrome c reductase iron-sulfur subunit N-terminal domain-containing protein n=1 Tax=Streptomyces doebereineriae TaxID=3075528 RepID=A0ABU2VH93_9ACTN|nr:ubiquinol-cytochrome c reductase iron-sulfur subunit N-terminal domain-containing protein [Streptomyces sp. DSM 41640]MDT0484554.1 ubiquinol-cytochrome c reductase iron-sulfur subunit N-terminal domain-containing protein [Streptomyces sp. DSM 41640]